MPKRLLLLRHAKSSWDDANRPDHERPLNDRGKCTAPQVGKLLRQSDRVPDLIVSSTARRARKTAQKVARASHYEGSILLYPELYNAPPERILEVLRRAPHDPATLLVVGHNPGLEEFASRILGQSVVLTTAALADLQCDITSWQEMTLEPRAVLLELWTPPADETS